MPNIPFLCHFVDSVSDKFKSDQSKDFRKFLAELKLLPKNHHLSDKCVLILSSILDREADIVCIELLRRGIDYVRLNSEEIPYTLSVSNRLDIDSITDCQIKLDSIATNLTDISAVWVRDFDYGLIHSNGNDLKTAFSFQQWGAALQILFSEIKYGWINSIDATHRTNNRVKQLTYAKQSGFNIPSTLITNNPETARAFYQEHKGDIIIKVLHHHDIELNNKVYSIYTHRVTNQDLIKFEDLIHAPSILQQRIHNSSELRVTVVKDKVFSVQLRSEASSAGCHDMHRIPLSRLQKSSVQLGEDFEQRCIKLVESFGLDYAAIDFVTDDDGNLFFLEVNPTGSWLWIERETKLPITRAVVDLIENIVSACP